MSELCKELAELWKEYSNLPAIEEHSKHCTQMRHYFNQKCTCDHQKRVDYSIELWNKIKTRLDLLSNVY